MRTKTGYIPPNYRILRKNERIKEGDIHTARSNCPLIKPPFGMSWEYHNGFIASYGWFPNAKVGDHNKTIIFARLIK